MSSMEGAHQGRYATGAAAGGPQSTLTLNNNINNSSPLPLHSSSTYRQQQQAAVAAAAAAEAKQSEAYTYAYKPNSSFLSCSSTASSSSASSSVLSFSSNRPASQSVEGGLTPSSLAPPTPKSRHSGAPFSPTPTTNAPRRVATSTATLATPSRRATTSGSSSSVGRSTSQLLRQSAINFPSITCGALSPSCLASSPKTSQLNFAASSAYPRTEAPVKHVSFWLGSGPPPSAVARGQSVNFETPVPLTPSRFRSGATHNSTTNNNNISTPLSVHSSASRIMNGGSSHASSSSSEALLEVLADYEARGWLSRGDFVRYRQILQQDPSSRYEVQRELDALQQQQQGHYPKNLRSTSYANSTASVNSGVQPLPSILLRHQSSNATHLRSKNSAASQYNHSLSASSSGSTTGRHVSWEDQSQNTNGSAEYNNNRFRQRGEDAPAMEHKKTSKHSQPWQDQDPDESDGAPADKDTRDRPAHSSSSSSSERLILEPSDLWQGGAVQLTEQQLQDIFVEMCFFARLGFVQPPCCLHCTYQDTMEAENNPQQQRSRPASSSNREKTCSRWVVWRKNAQTLLHPNRLDGNIFMVQCHAARRLLVGDVIEGRRWDPEQKQVVRVDDNDDVDENDESAHRNQWRSQQQSAA